MRHILLCILCVVLIPLHAYGGEYIHFTTADNQKHRRSRAMNAVVTECFTRLGFNVRITSMPSERSLYNANAGLQDGNFLRTKGISVAYPNLAVVPEPISKNVIVAYSRIDEITISGWESLLPYHVAWVRGWKNCDRELKRAKAITRVSNEDMLFRFLDEGRAQVGVFGLETGTEKLKKLGINSVGPLYPPIVESDLFLYLNVKHAGMIDSVVQVLREMKNDGTYDEIVERFYK